MTTVAEQERLAQAFVDAQQGVMHPRRPSDEDLAAVRRLMGISERLLDKRVMGLPGIDACIHEFNPAGRSIANDPDWNGDIYRHHDFVPGYRHHDSVPGPDGPWCMCGNSEGHIVHPRCASRSFTGGEL